MERFDQLDEFGRFGRLEEVIAGAKLAGLVHVFLAGRRCKNHDGQRSEMGLPANPFEDFEARFPGHVDVQQDKGWKRVLRTVGKRSFASEVLDGLLAVGHGTKRVGRAGHFKSVLKQENVVFFVFRVKDYRWGFHGGLADG